MNFKPFKIGKYLLLERIATGGMAEVYRAKASGAGGFEKQLAIKRILPNYSTNDEFRRMFEYEARLCSMLNHANIVQVYDFVKSSDTYLLAMEFVDGKNLRQFVNKARKLKIPIPFEFSLYVINEVCKGLEYAHSKKDDLTGKTLNIIHRDMSPQNIMVSYDGAVKIVDFGIAKAKGRVDQTRSGVIKGKFGYMSPEQANGKEITHSTDLFSTTIILYELITGRRLFAAENDIATLKRIQECIVRRPSLINPRIGRSLENLVLKGLSKDIRLRYTSAGGFHRKLQEYLNKNYAQSTQRDIADLMQKVFAAEIAQEKKRLEEIYRQSIPFSQGAEEDKKTTTPEAEGDATKSDFIGVTGETKFEVNDDDIQGLDGAGSTNTQQAHTESTQANELLNQETQGAETQSNLDSSLPTVPRSEEIQAEKFSEFEEDEEPSYTTIKHKLTPAAEIPDGAKELTTPGEDDETPENTPQPFELESQSNFEIDPHTATSAPPTENEAVGDEVETQKPESDPMQVLEESAPPSEEADTQPDESIPEQAEEAFASQLTQSRTHPGVSEESNTLTENTPNPRGKRRHSSAEPFELDPGHPHGDDPSIRLERSFNVKDSAAPDSEPNESPEEEPTHTNENEIPGLSDSKQLTDSGLEDPIIGTITHTATNPTNSRSVIETPPQTASQPVSPVTKERLRSQDSRKPTPKRSLWKSGSLFLILSLSFGGILWTYRYVSRVKSFPGPVTGFPEETKAELDRTPTAKTMVAAGGSCTIRVDSDPRKAEILVNGSKADKTTPTAISVPCDQSATITLLKSGYEPKDKVLIADKPVQKLYATLSKIPIGKVEFTISQNATLFVDGKKIRDLAANEPFQFSLRGNQKYRFKFVNPLLGIETEKEFFVKENQFIRKNVVLEIPR